MRKQFCSRAVLVLLMAVFLSGVNGPRTAAAGDPILFEYGDEYNSVLLEWGSHNLYEYAVTSYLPFASEPDFVTEGFAGCSYNTAALGDCEFLGFPMDSVTYYYAYACDGEGFDDNIYLSSLYMVEVSSSSVGSADDFVGNASRLYGEPIVVLTDQMGFALEPSAVQKRRMLTKRYYWYGGEDTFLIAQFVYQQDPERCVSGKIYAGKTGCDGSMMTGRRNTDTFVKTFVSGDSVILDPVDGSHSFELASGDPVLITAYNPTDGLFTVYAKTRVIENSQIRVYDLKGYMHGSGLCIGRSDLVSHFEDGVTIRHPAYVSSAGS